MASETNERERASKRQSSLSFSRQPAKAAVSLRSAPLGTSVVEHFNLKVIQRFQAFSSFDHFNYCFFVISECQNYTRLNNADRKITYGRNSYCDNDIGTGWFRFEGSARTRPCQLHVHLSKGVTLMLQAGWRDVVTPQ